MSKIYNEIVIDMNPESSSYGETLHEDSFEYEGDMMLLQDEEEEWQPTFTQDESLLGGGQQGGGGFQDPSPTIEMMGEDYGTPSVTYEDVMGMQEEDLLEFLKNTQFGGEWPGADQDAKDKIKEDMRTELGQGLPQLEQAAEEEMAFLETQFGGGDVSFAESLAGTQAGMARQTDMYGLQSGAEQIGKQAMAGQGGGGGMRGKMRARQQLGRGFQSTQEQYDLRQRQAGLGYESGVYGLEQAKKAEWETNFAELMGRLGEATGD